MTVLGILSWWLFERGVLVTGANGDRFADGYIELRPWNWHAPLSIRCGRTCRHRLQLVDAEDYAHLLMCNVSRETHASV